MMKRLLSVLMLFVFTVSVDAQIKDGSKWRSWQNPGKIVTANVTIRPLSNTADFSVTTSNGTSPIVAATPSGPNSVSQTQSTTVKYTDPENGSTVTGGTFRVKDGRSQEKQANGKWKTMRKKKENKIGEETVQMGTSASAGGSSSIVTPGEDTLGTAPAPQPVASSPLKRVSA